MSTHVAVTLRAAQAGDLAFLESLRATTMGRHHLNSGQSETPQQQRSRVLDHYECAQVIEQNGVPIGLWKVERSPAGWRLMQVQLLPAHQGAGIGGRLIRALIAEARAASVPLSLNVLKVNPARRLYERLGFRVVGETEHAHRMSIGESPG